MLPACQRTAPGSLVGIFSREIIKQAEKNLDHSLGAELEGLTVQRVLVKSDAARAIVQTAQEEKADLIIVPSHSQAFYEFLMGSVTGKVLHGAECPVWTDAHVEISPVSEFAIRNILCAVDFKPHNHKTVSWAAQLAAEFGGRLTLAHVTPGVKLWGPGGSYVDPEWKEALVGAASQHIAKLQQEMGIKAAVFVGSGDVPKVLGQAAKEMKADLLVTGSRPYGGHLGTHGYAIIWEVPIPILSV